MVVGRGVKFGHASKLRVGLPTLCSPRLAVMESNVRAQLELPGIRRRPLPTLNHRSRRNRQSIPGQVADVAIDRIHDNPGVSVRGRYGIKVSRLSGNDSNSL